MSETVGGDDGRQAGGWVAGQAGGEAGGAGGAGGGATSGAGGEPAGLAVPAVGQQAVRGRRRHRVRRTQDPHTFDTTT